MYIYSTKTNKDNLDPKKKIILTENIDKIYFLESNGVQMDLEHPM